MSEVSQHAFSEKVALITGGETSVGRAVALQLALYGAFVIIAVRRESEDSVLDNLKEMGTLASSVLFAEASEKAAGAVAEHVGQAFGRLDLLVNCGAEPVMGDEQNDLSGLEKSMEETLKSAFLITNACIPLTEGRPKARIVNVFEDGCRVDGTTDLGASCVGGAVTNLTQELAKSVPRTIKVNGVRYRATAAETNGLDPDLFPATGVRNADDIARVVLFLLSSEARSVNGQILEIG